jgi:hypothetical protein
MAAEILMDEPLARRGRRMLRALADSTESVVTSQYLGGSKLLMLYGVGNPKRMRIRNAHLAKGGRIVTWDMGYWDREVAMRLMVDSFHPTTKQLSLSNGTRREFELREYANHDGPILLVGLGHKSAIMCGIQPMSWEKKKLRELKARFPTKQILWRPKGSLAFPLPGTSLCHGNLIDEALNGCSLVVCRHSNVAVDACLHGVPVECEDGAAFALYQNNPNPSRDERLKFLHRLSWWTWKPSEAPEAWDWINKVLDAN